MCGSSAPANVKEGFIQVPVGAPVKCMRSTQYTNAVVLNMPPGASPWLGSWSGIQVANGGYPLTGFIYAYVKASASCPCSFTPVIACSVVRSLTRIANSNSDAYGFYKPPAVVRYFCSTCLGLCFCLSKLG